MNLYPAVVSAPLYGRIAAGMPALLRDHVKDRAGTKHDVVILGHDVARFQAQRAITRSGKQRVVRDVIVVVPDEPGVPCGLISNHRRDDQHQRPQPGSLSRRGW